GHLSNPRPASHGYRGPGTTSRQGFRRRTYTVSHYTQYRSNSRSSSRGQHQLERFTAYGRHLEPAGGLIREAARRPFSRNSNIEDGKPLRSGGSLQASGQQPTS